MIYLSKSILRQFAIPSSLINSISMNGIISYLNLLMVNI